MKQKRIILVADLGGVKAYQLSFPVGREPFPQLLEVIQFREAHERLQDIVSDEAGQFHERDSQGCVSESGERIHLELEVHQRLLRAAIKGIISFLKKYDPTLWGLAAPARMNKSILAAVSSPWSERLLVNIEQNLVNEPSLKLLSHFGESALTRHRPEAEL